MIPEEIANFLGAAVTVAVVRGTIIFGAALAAVSLARKLAPEARHLVWLGVIAAFVLVPLAWLGLPALPLDSGIPRRPAADLRLAVAPLVSRVEYTQAIERTSIDSILTLSGPALATRVIPLALVGVWLAGVAVLAGRFLIATVRLHQVASLGFADARVQSAGRAAARALSLRRGYQLLLSSRCRMPFSFGLLRPVVMLPAEAGTWPADRLASVLTHELAHVRRRDMLTQSLAYCVCIVFWFAPPVWLAYSAMLREAETCCDQQVIGRGVRAAAYAHSILELVRSCGGRMLLPCSSASLGKKGMLKGRIRTVLRLKPGQPRFRLLDAARVVAICLCCMLPVLAVFGQVQSRVLAADDPLVGTWVNYEVDAGTRFDVAKSVVEPNGHVLQYRHIADTDPVVEMWKSVEKAWVDAQGWHQYQLRTVGWDLPRQNAKAEGYVRERISPDGKTSEWVWGQYSYPEEITPLGPSYGIAYRQE